MYRAEKMGNWRRHGEGCKQHVGWEGRAQVSPVVKEASELVEQCWVENGKPLNYITQYLSAFAFAYTEIEIGF